MKREAGLSDFEKMIETVRELTEELKELEKALEALAGQDARGMESRESA
jgi:hypothetical protein